MTTVEELRAELAAMKESQAKEIEEVTARIEKRTQEQLADFKRDFLKGFLHQLNEAERRNEREAESEEEDESEEDEDDGEDSEEDEDEESEEEEDAEEGEQTQSDFTEKFFILGSGASDNYVYEGFLQEMRQGESNAADIPNTKCTITCQLIDVTGLSSEKTIFTVDGDLRATKKAKIKVSLKNENASGAFITWFTILPNPRKVVLLGQTAMGQLYWSMGVKDYHKITVSGKDFLVDWRLPSFFFSPQERED